MSDLTEGDAAPGFTLPRDGAETVSLEDLKGRKVVLFFYPKDDTSGCTAEAIAFTGLRSDFQKAGADVIGMSPDPVKKHDKFRDKHGLTVPLVSDEEKSTLEAYGVWKEKSMYGRKYMGVERSTFLIDENGRIARVWRKVKVPGHAEDVLAAVKAM
ncbi:thioredoxin-dependent thiol peroxidase [Pararhizobium haloflavum]|uniref:thioredoxin-dependent thiol peroxidase n=1 Tax=Pararhizobium haloflavum TaxID=2037914 RepID=UPI000C1A49FF|nr:thioredoxin-dependent thiol peroxidase [Pararhizobium haloflavum]